MVQEALLSLEVLKQVCKLTRSKLCSVLESFIMHSWHRGWGQELLQHHIINIVVTSENSIGRF